MMMTERTKRYVRTGSMVVLAVGIVGFVVFFAQSQPFLGTMQHTDEKLGTLTNTQQDTTTPHESATPTPPALEAAASSAGAPKGCLLSAVLTRNADTYQVTIADKGAGICKNVSYTVYYPQEETFVSSVPKPTASNYYWRVGNISAGQTVKGAAITVSGAGTDTELCAAADNGADSCVNVSSTASPPVPTSTPVPAPMPTPTPTPTTTQVPAVTGEYGVWVWDSAYSMTSAKQASVIAQAKAAGFNVIYITIDDYLTIPDTSKAAYADALSSFIGQAHAAGMEVDSVAGWRDWAKTANRQKGYTLISFVDAYNKSHVNRIRSFQYDVEPYLLPEYETSKAAVLTDFVSFIDESVTHLSGVDVRFSVVIPHFYDQAQNWTPLITYNGQTAATYTHILRILDKRAGSSILIMAYRNTAAGDDGSIQLSKVEVQEAQGHTTKVIVAQETGNVEPSYVTFFGTSKASLATQVAAIRTTFSTASGFGGIAIHYIDPYVALP